eukprot:1056040-Ditylum_brightwellii.AAC.1
MSNQLYSLYAEAEYSICNIKEVCHVTGIIIQSAKSFQDKQCAYAILINKPGFKRSTLRILISTKIKTIFQYNEKRTVRCWLK